MNVRFQGIADQTAKFLQKEQLSDPKLWAKFVDLYRSQPDGENQGWRGEYWGKMMRGGALVCSYTKDPVLYDILTDSVRDMMTVAEEDGRVSSYSRETEFDSWDLWGRKYVILASEYYLEICQDETLKQELKRIKPQTENIIGHHVKVFRRLLPLFHSSTSELLSIHAMNLSLGTTIRLPILM